MKRTPFIFLVFVFVSLCVPLFSAEALTISPARFEISGDPGQTLQGEVLLFEDGPSSKHYFISFENFEPRGDSGAPYFIGAKDGLATWINASNEITVPGEGVETSLPFSITIPQNTKPGGYFGAIFFGTQPPAGGGGQVSVGGKVGMLILLRVNGDIEEGGGLLDFSTFGGKKLVTTPPLVFEYRFGNDGGDRVVPRGTIILKNTFRFKTDEIDANLTEGSVLPGSARKFVVGVDDEGKTFVPGEEEVRGFFTQAKMQWKDFRFGWYTAKLRLVWGQNSQVSEDTFHFFVIPWQILILIFAGLYGVLALLRFTLRRYNAWIIRQAQGGAHAQTSHISHRESHKVPQVPITNISSREKSAPQERREVRDVPQQPKPPHKPRRRI